jgi:hypothetical protein
MTSDEIQDKDGKSGLRVYLPIAALEQEYTRMMVPLESDAFIGLTSC